MMPQSSPWAHVNKPRPSNADVFINAFLFLEAICRDESTIMVLPLENYWLYMFLRVLVGICK